MVKRSGKMNGLAAKVHNGAAEGLILSGDLIAQRAQGHVHVVSGDLQRSLERGNPYAVAGGMAISVGSNLDYAEEEETREGTKGGTSHAYLRPALRESKRESGVLIAKRIVAKMVKP